VVGGHLAEGMARIPPIGEIRPSATIYDPLAAT